VFPIVHIGRRLDARVPFADVDYAAASADVLAHLSRTGHRRVCYLREPADTPGGTRT
jgi:DNA-binding LacI/PurR family transcriptional regulator